MRQYIEPFVASQIATCQTADEVTTYYDASDEILAEAYFHDGVFYSAVFYGKSEHQTPITKEQAEKIAKYVQTVFQQEQLIIDSIEQINDEFIVQLKMIEPVYEVPIRGTGMNMTISETGFVEEVSLNDNDVTITYPDNLISKEEARAILRQQPILTLGIEPELGWQYVYKQNYDLYGIAPDGSVRLWSEDELMQDASFKPLMEVEDISDLETFLKGGRQAIVESTHNEDEQQWFIESDEQLQLKEDVFIRACKVVKHLVGNQCDNYFIEQCPTLRRLFLEEDEIFERFRFVYIYNDISFDFNAITVNVNTKTNQIQSITFPHIPFEMFSSLPLPKLSLQEANHIAQQLIDVELTLESDIHDHKKQSFVYLKTYPTSPTGGHIQYVDCFTGEIHWIDNRWS